MAASWLCLRGQATWVGVVSSKVGGCGRAQRCVGPLALEALTPHIARRPSLRVPSLSDGWLVRGLRGWNFEGILPGFHGQEPLARGLCPKLGSVRPPPGLEGGDGGRPASAQGSKSSQLPAPLPSPSSVDGRD